MADNPNRMQWFEQARLGMFIHWGPYSQVGRGEMVHSMHGLSKEQYEPNVRRWKANRYDPRQWARLARQTGCRYMVLTTKHNDGFCLFRTKTTDWQSINLGPKRDLVSPYVKACRDEGLKVGFYFSLHDYWQEGGLPSGYFSSERRKYTPSQYQEYYQLVQEQLRELCTQYGRVDMLFYDGGLPADPDGKAAKPITAMVRRLQPQIVVNNRDNNDNDYDTPENLIKASQGKRPWESCMTIGPQWWGYHNKDGPLKSVGELCFWLQQTASGGGNMLLNVGPRGDGVIPSMYAGRLEGIGRWLAANGQAIYGSRRGFNILCTCGAPTVVGDDLFIHAFRYEAPTCTFRGVINRVRRVTCLPTGRRVKFKQTDSVVTLLDLPAKAPDPVATVYKIEVEGSLKTEF